MVAINDVLVVARREIAAARADGGRGGDYAEGLARGLSLGRAVSEDEERGMTPYATGVAQVMRTGSFAFPSSAPIADIIIRLGIALLARARAGSYDGAWRR